MNFFKRFLIKSEDYRMIKQSKSLYDLFSFNLRMVPDTSFVRMCEQVSKGGSISTLYTNNLANLECDLFHTMEVKVYGEFDHKSISLISNNTGAVSLAAIEKLVNSCYDIYGPDDSYSPRGRFDDLDKIAIAKKMWSGRMWTAPHHKPGAMLLMDSEKLEMVIWMKGADY